MVMIQSCFANKLDVIMQVKLTLNKVTITLVGKMFPQNLLLTMLGSGFRTPVTLKKSCGQSGSLMERKKDVWLLQNLCSTYGQMYPAVIQLFLYVRE